MEHAFVVVVLAVGVSVIAGPLRAARHDLANDRRLAEIAELEAARDQKLGEIQDAELDLRTGKLRRSREWSERKYILNFFASW
jgi:hypothetical protein